MSKEIGFYKISLDKKLDEVRKGLLNDPLLHDAILYHSDQLAENDIETWLVEKNMIVTEEGYKVAMYEEDNTGVFHKYIDMCGSAIQNLIALIEEKNLSRYFSSDDLKIAREIIRIHLKRKEKDD
jgi:hypothetical protein